MAEKKVKLYVTDFCPYCNLAKDWLRKRGISWQEINVQGNKAAAAEMIRKSGQSGVPVIEINGKIIVGFDPAKMAAALGIKK